MEEVKQITFHIPSTLGFYVNKGKGKLGGFQWRKALAPTIMTNISVES